MCNNKELHSHGEHHDHEEGHPHSGATSHDHQHDHPSGDANTTGTLISKIDEVIINAKTAN